MLRGFSGGVSTECVWPEWILGMDKFQMAMRRIWWFDTSLNSKHTGNVQTSGLIARDQIKSCSVDKLFSSVNKNENCSYAKAFRYKAERRQNKVEFCWIKLHWRILVLKLFSSTIILYSKCRLISLFKSVKVTSWLPKRFQNKKKVKESEKEKFWNFSNF